MYAPVHMCEKLAVYHSGLRLGWDGEENKFGLLMVARKRLAARTYHGLWAGRGPVFSKNGRPRPDWDEVVKTPMHLAELSPEDVFSGRVLKLVKRWTRPLAARTHESAKAESRRIEGQLEETGHKMGLDLYRKGQSGGYGAPVVAKKFVEPTINQKRMRNGEFDKSNSLMPPPPPGGWEKHLAMDEGDPDDLGSVSTK